LAIEAPPQAQYFSLRTPLLSEGRTTTLVAQADLMTVMIKVYAEGGENALHAHTHEDHCFIVLDGEATFYDEHDTPTVVHKYEGILLPRGAYYYFQNSGQGNLVLARAGARAGDSDAHSRINLEGGPLPADSAANKKVVGVPIPGRFFGD